MLELAMRFLLLCLIALACTHCGIPINTTGTGISSSNEPRPAGTPIAQGSITGLNGETMVGTALIFNTYGSNFVLRLENFASNSAPGLVVQVFHSVSPNPIFSSPLRLNSGSQNYSFSAGTLGGRFTNMAVYSNALRTTFGGAALTSPYFPNQPQ